MSSYKMWRKLFRETVRQNLIHTDRQTDRRTDRHKSFIDMRYNTEQYSKSNSIEKIKIKSAEEIK